ncbi:MAG: hypothetical protein RMX65_030820 [Nostoc sp. DedQUE01]|nr:hypothetical protein [Nostoc sp. DedQUE01]
MSDRTFGDGVMWALASLNAKSGFYTVIIDNKAKIKQNSVSVNVRQFCISITNCCIQYDYPISILAVLPILQSGLRSFLRIPPAIRYS